MARTRTSRDPDSTGRERLRAHYPPISAAGCGAVHLLHQTEARNHRGFCERILCHSLCNPLRIAGKRAGRNGCVSATSGLAICRPKRVETELYFYMQVRTRKKNQLKFAPASAQRLSKSDRYPTNSAAKHQQHLHDPATSSTSNSQLPVPVLRQAVQLHPAIPDRRDVGTTAKGAAGPTTCPLAAAQCSGAIRPRRRHGR